MDNKPFLSLHQLSRVITWNQASHCEAAVYDDELQYSILLTYVCMKATNLDSRVSVCRAQGMHRG